MAYISLNDLRGLSGPPTQMQGESDQQFSNRLASYFAQQDAGATQDNSQMAPQNLSAADLKVQAATQAAAAGMSTTKKVGIAAAVLGVAGIGYAAYKHYAS